MENPMFPMEKRILSIPPRSVGRIRTIFGRYSGFDSIPRTPDVDAWIGRTEAEALRSLSVEAVCLLEPVMETNEAGVRTASGIFFPSPRMGEVLDGACGMAAMALRLRGEEALSGRGDFADQMLYDLWANAVLETAASDLRVSLKREFRDRGFFVTPTWSPGQNGIDLSNQVPLFKLLHPEEIGITLGPGNLMEPLKSVTQLFGCGWEVLRGQLVPCDFCDSRSACVSAYFESLYDKEEPPECSFLH